MKDMTITFQLCDNDRELIAKLISNLENFIETNTQPKPSQPERTQPEHPAPDTSHIEPDTEVTALQEEPAPPEEPEKPLTMDDVPSVDELRYKVVQLVSQGKKEAVKAIINEYAPSVAEVPANKRIECMERLQGLEG